jgi:signal transduction histidine kinase
MDERRLRLLGFSAQTYVQGDWTELSQALDNLINNAFEHGGGEILVEVRKDPDWVYLSVLDGGGPGCPERLSRARRGVGGGRRGHGLRVAARVAREHGGDFSFWASSEGSEARLRLPRAEAGER